MWSVNQVLQNAGATPLGGYNNQGVVPGVDSGLSSGELQSVPSSSAQPGDVVVWWGGGGASSFSACQANESCNEHIGICLNVGCTNAIANSSSSSTANECSFSDYGSALNPQGQGSNFVGAQVFQLNS
jgi:hypothetical protein